MTADDGTVRRRRRRRRRRGRGGVGAGEAAATADGAVPERNIFRVDGAGAAEHTGEAAPPQPNRSIAPVDRKAAPVAVEPPPPSLSVPREPAKVARPARGRRPAARDVVEPVMAALPAPAPDAAAPSGAGAPAPRKRGRPRKVDAAAIRGEPGTGTAPARVHAAVATEPAAAPKRRGRPPKAVATAAADGRRGPGTGDGGSNRVAAVRRNRPPRRLRLRPSRPLRRPPRPRRLRLARKRPQRRRPPRRRPPKRRARRPARRVRLSRPLSGCGASPAPLAAWAIFIDFDGTITDRDTFDVLVEHFAGRRRVGQTERGLDDGSATIRDVLRSRRDSCARTTRRRGALTARS